jgi:hypothetical protein
MSRFTLIFPQNSLYQGKVIVLSRPTHAIHQVPATASAPHKVVDLSKPCKLNDLCLQPECGYSPVPSPACYLEAFASNPTGVCSDFPKYISDDYDDSPKPLCSPMPSDPSDNQFEFEFDPLTELMNLELPETDDDLLLSFTDLIQDDTSFPHSSNPESLLKVHEEIKIPNQKSFSIGPTKATEVIHDRKRSSNREAALRYREKKRKVKESFDLSLKTLRDENNRLKAQLQAEYQSASLLIDLAKGIIC